MRPPDAGFQSIELCRHYAPAAAILGVLLLIAVMMTPIMSFPQTHNKIPSAANALPERTLHPMLGIDYTGTYWLVTDGVGEQLAPDRLRDRFAEVFATRDERVLFISASPTTEYGIILDIVAAAQAARVGRISLLATCPPGREGLLERCNT